MFNEKTQELLTSTLAADTYCLGAHWIYDADELKGLSIDWKELNAPSSPWHKGKTKGDFTHYGDQIVILNDFLKDKSSFNVEEYMLYWREQMNTFTGYKDGSTKDTIVNIDNGEKIPCGSASQDMSIVGKIVPLLNVSKNKEEFLQNVKLFAQATHNKIGVLEAIDFFANLLVTVLEGKDIKESVLTLKEDYSDYIKNYITQGIDSKDEDTVSTLNKFGTPCPVKNAFPAVIHLLFKYDNYEEALIQNAKAGGDSSARAMILTYLLVARDTQSIVPQNWLKFNHKI